MSNTDWSHVSNHWKHLA